MAGKMDLKAQDVALCRFSRDELGQLRGLIWHELRFRPPTHIRCCECERVYEIDPPEVLDPGGWGSDKLMRHLIRQHRYPNEDAGLASWSSDHYIDK